MTMGQELSTQVAVAAFLGSRRLGAGADGPKGYGGSPYLPARAVRASRTLPPCDEGISRTDLHPGVHVPTGASTATRPSLLATAGVSRETPAVTNPIRPAWVAGRKEEN